MREKILITILLLNLFLLPLAVAQSTTSSETIQISPTETIKIVECAGEGENVYDMSSKGPTSCCAGLILKPCEGICTPSIPGKCISPPCPIDCICDGNTVACPIIISCISPCIKNDDTCTCPVETVEGTVCKIDCICTNGTMTCPIEPPVCNSPCIKSGDTCTCPIESAETCPMGCTCDGNTTTCPTEEEKPITTSVESTTGTSAIEIKKNGDKLEIKSSISSAISTETFTIENSKLFMETSAGNQQIKVLPEEASSKATAATGITIIKEIELKEESSVSIYYVKGTKEAKILAIFPITLEIETKVSAESGEIVSINKSWWSFLAW